LLSADEFIAQGVFFFRSYLFLQDLTLLDVGEEHLPALLAMSILDRLKSLRFGNRSVLRRSRRDTEKIKTALRERFGKRVQ
jgi:hypothetical protein